MCLVALLLLVEDVELDLEVVVDPLLVGDVLQRLHQLEADELVPHAVPVLDSQDLLTRLRNKEISSYLQSRCGDDQTVDEGQEHGAVVVVPGLVVVVAAGLDAVELVDDDLEAVALGHEGLVVLEGLDGPVVALGRVDAERAEQLEDLLLHLSVARVQGWKNDDKEAN